MAKLRIPYIFQPKHFCYAVVGECERDIASPAIMLSYIGRIETEGLAFN